MKRTVSANEDLPNRNRSLVLIWGVNRDGRGRLRCQPLADECMWRYASVDSDLGECGFPARRRRKADHTQVVIDLKCCEDDAGDAIAGISDEERGPPDGRALGRIGSPDHH